MTQPLRRREHLITGEWESADLVASYRKATGLPLEEANIAWWVCFSRSRQLDEQLDGMSRPLDGIEGDEGLSEASRELLRNVRTIVRRLDHGEDVTSVLDVAKAQRPGEVQRRVNVGFPRLDGGCSRP